MAETYIAGSSSAWSFLQLGQSSKPSTVNMSSSDTPHNSATTLSDGWSSLWRTPCGSGSDMKSTNPPVRSSTTHLKVWKLSKLHPWSWPAGPMVWSKIELLWNFSEDSCKICCKYVAHSCASAVCRISSSCVERDAEFTVECKKVKHDLLYSQYTL